MLSFDSTNEACRALLEIRTYCSNFVSWVTTVHQGVHGQGKAVLTQNRRVHLHGLQLFSLGLLSKFLQNTVQTDRLYIELQQIQLQGDISTGYEVATPTQDNCTAAVPLYQTLLA